MQFILIDKILELNKGSDITAIKTLSIAEEYLKDHFPQISCNARRIDAGRSYSRPVRGWFVKAKILLTRWSL